MMAVLKREAKRLGTSVNILILQMIERGLGLKTRRVKYHDLDHLIGTWTSDDAKQFKESTKQFEKIDKELWK